MSITITLTISLHDTDEATDRIINNSEVSSKLQQISENQCQVGIVTTQKTGMKMTSSTN